MEKNHSRSFRLIREYPGSPKLNSIHTPNGFQVISANTSIYNVEKYQEFWQEIIEDKDYKILSYINPHNKLIYYPGVGIYENGYISCTEHHYITKEYCEKYNNIYSIKRLSDGKIFSIGDLVTLDSSNQFNGDITEFRIYIYNKLQIFYKGFDYLENIIKVKQKLFTTEDGVDIFEGDTFYWIEVNNWSIKTQIAKYSEFKVSFTYGKYATENAAMKYILYHKPMLSLAEIEDIKIKNGYLGDSLFLHLKELVINKLK